MIKIPDLKKNSRLGENPYVFWRVNLDIWGKFALFSDIDVSSPSCQRRFERGFWWLDSDLLATSLRYPGWQTVSSLGGFFFPWKKTKYFSNGLVQPPTWKRIPYKLGWKNNGMVSLAPFLSLFVFAFSVWGVFRSSICSHVTYIKSVQEESWTSKGGRGGSILSQISHVSWPCS